MNIDNNSSVYLNGTEIVRIVRNGVTIWEKVVLPDYFYLKNISNQSGVFQIGKVGSPTSPDMQYSLNGISWTNYNFSTLPTVNVPSGSNIYFRGDNTTNQFNKSDTDYFYFKFSKDCEGHGNICSLLSKNNFENVYLLNDYCFCELFMNLTTLQTPPHFGIVKYVSNSALDSCFNACQNLKMTPDFSNITLCYQYAFYYCFANCFNLKTAYAPKVTTWDTTNNTFAYWLCLAGSQVSGTKTVYCPTGVTIPVDYRTGIPSDWTRIDY